MPLPPELTPEQRQAALEKAAAARKQRAEVKERLKAGALSLEQLFKEGDEDETLAKLKVVSVLESMPGVGKVRRASTHGGARHQREPAVARAGRQPAQEAAPAVSLNHLSGP